MKILIFGSNGFIGSTLSDRFQKTGNEVLRVSRDVLNFGTGGEDIKIRALLEQFEPDVIVNAIGEIDIMNKSTPQAMFDSLLLPSASLYRHFQQFSSSRNIEVLTFGSEAEGLPRTRYPIYAALKTAEASLIKSATESFANTPITWHRVRLPRLNGGLGIESSDKTPILESSRDRVWSDVIEVLGINYYTLERDE